MLAFRLTRNGVRPLGSELTKEVSVYEEVDVGEEQYSYNELFYDELDRRGRNGRVRRSELIESRLQLGNSGDIASFP